jgi:hypothetical protein
LQSGKEAGRREVGKGLEEVKGMEKLNERTAKAENLLVVTAEEEKKRRRREMEEKRKKNEKLGEWGESDEEWGERANGISREWLASNDWVKIETAEIRVESRCGQCWFGR